MPFKIVKGDITKMDTDAIVNAANSSLLGGGGVDGAIHRAAGPELLEECRTLGGCETGRAKITRAYHLPAKFVIHTVGPIWYGGGNGEAEKLASCYRESLRLAEEHGCESVAFPLISAGAYGYPKDQALQVATETVRSFLEDHEMDVSLVIWSREDFAFNRECHRRLLKFLAEGLSEQEADHLMNMERARRAAYMPAPQMAPKPVQASPKATETGGSAPKNKKGFLPSRKEKEALQETVFEATQACAPYPAQPSEEMGAVPAGLDDFLHQMDEGFRGMLLRKIDERGITDADCYKAANIDRKLFNKIKNNKDYRPGKSTVLALAVALHLPLSETREMLRKAGFSLSRSTKFDLIVEFFIREGNYDIYQINEALFYFDQKLLGSLN